MCHSEVKHNLKNISLHLNNVHHMSPQEYENQFGRLPDTKVVMMEQQRPSARQQQEQWENDDGGEGGGGEEMRDDYGFGSHFMVNDAGAGAGDGADVEMSAPPASQQRHQQQDPGPRLAAPPKADVVNPRCKFCRVCNRDFNRRQAFVEHCRNVHGMKIKFAGGGSGHSAFAPVAKQHQQQQQPQQRQHQQQQQQQQQQPPQLAQNPRPPGRARLDCEHCGKVFSNRSNRNRHVILSCEMRKVSPSSDAIAAEQRQLEEEESEISSEVTSRDAAVAPLPSTLKGTSRASAGKTDEDDDYPYRNKVKEPIKCPYPDCQEVTMRSALMKRHLFEAHAIQQNVVVSLPDLEEERKKAQVKGEATGQVKASREGDEEDKKVPPLRVKLSNLDDADGAKSERREGKKEESGVKEEEESDDDCSEENAYLEEGDLESFELQGGPESEEAAVLPSSAPLLTEDEIEVEDGEALAEEEAAQVAIE